MTLLRVETIKYYQFHGNIFWRDLSIFLFGAVLVLVSEIINPVLVSEIISETDFSHW